MTNIVVVCQKEHEKGYEDFVGVCLLCEIERAVLAEREACAKVCEKICADITYWHLPYEGLTAETKFIRSLGAIGQPFIEAIRARGQQ